jgi:hypothetical protein
MQEMEDVATHGVSAYIQSAWNMFDLFIIIVGAYVFFLTIFQMTRTPYHVSKYEVQILTS